MKYTCQICGKEFITYLNWIKRGGGKFCSRICAGVSKNKKISKVCLFCGCDFKVKPSTAIHNASKYCSPKCGQLASRGKKKPSITGDKAPNWRGGHTLVIKYCVDCGEKIYYRSDRCHSCAKKGELSPIWQGGISSFPYSFDFNDEVRDKIRKRDDYNCKICGMTEEENILISNRLLSVHHIDYNKENSNKHNLISLCNQCHSRTNYNRAYWTEFFKSKVLNTGG